MENTEQSLDTGNFNNKRDLPNAVAILVLGIVSIVTCWCYGIIGIITAVIALVLSKKDLELYNENPDAFTQSSYKNLNAGKITAIIGLSLSALYVIFIVIYFVIILGSFATLVPEIFQNSF